MKGGGEVRQVKLYAHVACAQSSKSTKFDPRLLYMIVGYTNISLVLDIYNPGGGGGGKRHSENHEPWLRKQHNSEAMKRKFSLEEVNTNKYHTTPMRAVWQYHQINLVNAPLQLDANLSNLTSSRNSRTCCSNSAIICEEEQLEQRRDVELYMSF